MHEIYYKRQYWVKNYAVSVNCHNSTELNAYNYEESVVNNCYNMYI